MAAPCGPRGSHVPHCRLTALALAACLPLCAANGISNVVMLGGHQSADRMRVVAVAPRLNVTQASISALFDTGFAGVEVQVRQTLDRRLVVFGTDSLATVAPETCPDEICGDDAHTRLTEEEFTNKMQGSITQMTWQHFLEHVTRTNGHKVELLDDVLPATPTGKFLVLEPASPTNPGEPAGFLAQQAGTNNWAAEKMQVVFRRYRDARTFKQMASTASGTSPYRVWYRRKVHDYAAGWTRTASGDWFEGDAGSLEEEAKTAIDNAAQNSLDGVTFEADTGILTNGIDAYRTSNGLELLAAFGWDRLEGSDYVAGALAMQGLPISLYSFTTHLSPDVEAWVAAGQPDTWMSPTSPPPPPPPSPPPPGGSNLGMIVVVVLLILVLGAVAAYVSSSQGDAKDEEANAGGSSVEMKAGRV